MGGKTITLTKNLGYEGIIGADGKALRLDCQLKKVPQAKIALSVLLARYLFY